GKSERRNDEGAIAIPPVHQHLITFEIGDRQVGAAVTVEIGELALERTVAASQIDRLDQVHGRAGGARGRYESFDVPVSAPAVSQVPAGIPLAPGQFRSVMQNFPSLTPPLQTCRS